MAHYDAAKAGDRDVRSGWSPSRGAEWGVRSNALVPLAHTRMWEDHKSAIEGPTFEESKFDREDPANVSPLVAWLAEADCPANRQTLYIFGGHLWVLDFPAIIHTLQTEGRWTLEALDQQLSGRLVTSPTGSS